MTVGQLAKRAGVSVATVNRVLAGSRAASIANVQSVAGALGLDIGLRTVHRAKTLRIRQAVKKASRAIKIAHATAALEGQGVGAKTAKALQKQVARRLLRSKRRLWEE